MKTKYVIHQEGESIVVYDSRLEKSKTRLFKRVSLSFLLGSLIGLIIFLSPILIAEGRYRLSKAASPTKTEFSRFGQLLWLDEKGILSPPNWEFSLIIPEISLNTKVEESIDIKNQKEYQLALKTGVAHAKGTSLPGDQGTTYIFGHSTDYPWNIGYYSAHFYPLRYLEEGKEIIIIYQGKSHLYEVTEKEVVAGKQLEYLVSGSQERLVLQTCWPPGTTWKRLIVVAEPIKEI